MSDNTVTLTIVVLMCCSGVSVTGNAVEDFEDNVNDFHDDIQERKTEEWVKAHA